MAFDKRSLQLAMDSCSNLNRYFADIRSFFEVVDARLATGECGVPLVSLEPTRLYSSVHSYSLYGHAKPDSNGEPGSSHAYLWFPTWLGSFYVRQDTRLTSSSSAGRPLENGLLAFVWIWI